MLARSEEQEKLNHSAVDQSGEFSSEWQRRRQSQLCEESQPPLQTGQCGAPEGRELHPGWGSRVNKQCGGLSGQRTPPPPHPHPQRHLSLGFGLAFCCL